jgi:hypothetical protein
LAGRAVAWARTFVNPTILQALNESRQLTPGDRDWACWTSLARRSCARRWAASRGVKNAMTRFLRLLLVATALSVLLGGLIYLVTLATIPLSSPAAKMRAGYYDNWPICIGGGYSILPERDWTLKLGKECCGVQKYVLGTRIVCGRFSVLIPCQKGWRVIWQRPGTL